MADDDELTHHIGVMMPAIADRLDLVNRPHVQMDGEEEPLSCGHQRDDGQTACVMQGTPVDTGTDPSTSS